MSDEQGKNRGTVIGHHHEPQYGTFQGVANYPPPLPAEHTHHHHHSPPAFCFPQPVPPPGAAEPCQQGYQIVPGCAVVEREQRCLPCCVIGLGWFMFIIGFFLAAIPWYVGAIVLMCSRLDRQEKPGYIACTIAAIVATLAIILGATKGAHDW